MMYFDSSIVRKGGSKQALWAKKGMRKYIPYDGSRQSVIMNGALDTKTGKTVFYLTKKLNSEIFIQFLLSLLGEFPVGAIILVVDNASWHKSKQVKKFLEGNPRLRLYFLPPYCPELNPVEKLWKWMKHCLNKNRFYKTLGDLKIAIGEFCSLLGENGQLVLRKVGFKT